MTRDTPSVIDASDNPDSGDSTASEHAVHRNMALTRAEFLRSLPGALCSEERFEVAADVVIIDRPPGRSVVITLQAAAERRLGALRLPVLEVKLVFRGYDNADRGAFLERFGRTFQRGGG